MPSTHAVTVVTMTLPVGELTDEGAAAAPKAAIKTVHGVRMLPGFVLEMLVEREGPDSVSEWVPFEAGRQTNFFLSRAKLGADDALKLPAGFTWQHALPVAVGPSQWDCPTCDNYAPNIRSNCMKHIITQHTQQVAHVLLSHVLLMRDVPSLVPIA
jgi:hypothetical protein